MEETVFEALAACYAAVLPEERREGIAVVDIGAQSTELVVYYGDAMQLASTVPICGDHFTRDLAQGLCLSFEDAELVKMEYGCATCRSPPPRTLIEVDLPAPENREPRAGAARASSTRSWKRAPRAVPAMCARELARVGMERALMGGVFLTGGGAQLPGPVRRGRAGAAVPGAVRPADRDSGLAGEL